MNFGDRDDGISVFQLHECAISQVASNLLGLCRKTMEEATDHQVNNAGPSLALLPPTIYRTQGSCLIYIYLLSLGNEFRAKFPPLKEGGDVHGNVLWQMCTFVDLVPPF
jgi:hypothetical protein